VSDGGKRLARYVLQEITAAFRLLASHPEAGHLRQDLTTLSVKFWSVFSYLIVHEPAPSPIAIVRCWTADETCAPSLSGKRSSLLTPLRVMNMLMAFFGSPSTLMNKQPVVKPTY
jgi:hypothetical protein